MAADEPLADVRRSSVAANPDERVPSGVAEPREGDSSRLRYAPPLPQPELSRSASESEQATAQTADEPLGDGSSVNPDRRDYAADLHEVLNAPSDADAAALKHKHHERYGEDPVWTALLQETRDTLRLDIRIKELQLRYLRQELLETNEIMREEFSEEPQDRQ
ncbi:unnamed protein product [Peniophora sp. CBMAI 1063]|nr:unnamed protein product [Peniophora sp. CBMAI 1063]